MEKLSDDNAELREQIARLEKLPEIFNKLIFTDGWWWSQVTQQKYNTVREAIDAHQRSE